ncbi:protein SSUH2 homolog isoform X1 [Mytilus edulis]|uniref:protein SSUH2 homolog isoform X1 n=1 Tax=Mytilus edulis TaxID=6550 RepID=UPI0039EE2C6E
MSENDRLLGPGKSGYQGGQTTPYPPSGGYQGTQPGGSYQGGPPTGGYPGGQQAGGYSGGQPAGGYPSGQPAGGYPGGQPAGGYSGGQPAGGYPGGQPAGAYPGTTTASNQESGYIAPPQGVSVPQYTGAIPENEAPTEQQSAPTAPPLEKMDAIPGYQNIGFTESFLPPPPTYQDAMKGPPPERQNISNVPTITEQEARDALLEFVADNCCYGKKAAEDLNFNDLKSSSAFHYTMESFTEARSTEWAYEPYTGQTIDGPHNGPAPGPWDIQSKPSQLFKNEARRIEVPHTASIKPCHHCFASGFIRCHKCQGRGRTRCFTCNGSGMRMGHNHHHHDHHNHDHHHHHHGFADDNRCTWCHGSGFRDCGTCHTRGMVVCPLCRGYHQLKCYICLTIKWHTEEDHHIVERTALPDHLIKQAQGQVAFEESMPRVYPITQFQESEVNQASASLVAKHQFPSKAILMQRQRVRIVPVTVCMYKWKDADADFIVYGFEKKVYAPNYPQKCCCGCSII